MTKSEKQVKTKQPKVIYATKNENEKVVSFTFEKYPNEADKIFNICSRCKYLDCESDFPNFFCDKSCEMIDCQFCSPKCPLGKWELVDPDITPTLKEQNE